MLGEECMCVKRFLLVFMFMNIVLFTAACRPNDASGGHTNTIIVAGSTTVTPVMRELALVFEAEHRGVSIEVQELGTSAGINATLQGVSDIAMSSRAITQDEQAQGIMPIAFAIDGIAVVVHPHNPVRNLSLEEITAVFRGEITNWQALGGNNHEITVVSREEGSGIRTTFETFASVQDPHQVRDKVIMASAVSRRAIICQGTGAVIAAVSDNPNAIGYVTTGVVAPGFDAVSINGVHFSEQAVLEGTYAFANTFFIGVMDDLSDAARDFVAFILSDEGQSVVRKSGYVRFVS